MNEAAAQSDLVSVIIPTYNRSALVARAVKSVLVQSYRQLEVLVVDDGSTDNTRQVIEGIDPRVRYLYQANAGVAFARNRGIANARGEFLAFLDSDDEWLPWKLAAEVALLRAHHDANLVWSDMSAIAMDGSPIAERYLRTYYLTYETVQIEEWMKSLGALGQVDPSVPRDVTTAVVRKGSLFPALVLGNLVHTSTVVLRRGLIEKVGGFDESLSACEDYDLWLRGSQLGDYLLLEAPTILYRIGGEDQLSNPLRLKKFAHSNLRIVRQWLDAAGATAKLAPGILRSRMAWALAWVGEEELRTGGWPTSRYFLESLRYRPRQPRTVAFLLVGLLPPPLVRALLAAYHRVRRRAPRPVAHEQTGNVRQPRAGVRD